MASISLVQVARLLGTNSVLGMAQKCGLTPPPPPISVRNLISLAEHPILPLPPVDLRPQNGTIGVSNKPNLFFRDPGQGTRAAASGFDFNVTQNNVLIGSAGSAQTASPLPPAGITWPFPLPQGEVTLHVRGSNSAGQSPFSTSTFTVGTTQPPPPPPTPPSNLVGISKLSLFNCQIDRHTVFIWVRDVLPIVGPWGLIQTIPTQYNESGQCPYDENGILADSASILTSNGEGGGFVCTDGNVYQVSIVDPERPTCDGRNDPDIGNCVVEDQPSFFKFNSGGDEMTVMLQDGRLSPVPS
jgi:hypothetical protein